jgi:hypothetical protein
MLGEMMEEIRRAIDMESPEPATPNHELSFFKGVAQNGSSADE